MCVCVSVSKWFHWLDSIGRTHLSEVDCKDQFNNVDPADIQKHLSEAIEWLSKRKRWRMSEIIWSVNRDSKKLDRAGTANSTKFWFITHTQMTDTIQFKMENNNFIQAAGKLWFRQGCIPMGGSFSAQAADLHSLWSVYKSRHLCPGQRVEFKTGSSSHDPYPPPPLLPSLHLCRRPQQRQAVVPNVGRGTHVCRSMAASVTAVRVPREKSGQGCTCRHRPQSVHKSPRPPKNSLVHVFHCTTHADAKVLHYQHDTLVAAKTCTLARRSL